MLLKVSDKQWLCIVVQSKWKAVETEFKKADKQLDNEIKKVLGPKKKSFETYGMAYLYLYVTDCEKVEMLSTVPPHVHMVSRQDQDNFYERYHTSTVFGCLD